MAQPDIFRFGGGCGARSTSLDTDSISRAWNMRAMNGLNTLGAAPRRFRSRVTKKSR